MQRECMSGKYVRLNDAVKTHYCTPPPPSITGGHPLAGDIWECDCKRLWFYYWHRGSLRWWDTPMASKGRTRDKALGLR